MKATFEPYIYHCPNCSTVQKHYTWSKTLATTRHLCDHGGCGTMLTGKDVIQQKKPDVVGIRTPTKNRV